jgi:hypothetical protein
LPLPGIQPGAVDFGALAARTLFFKVGLAGFRFAFLAFLAIGLASRSSGDLSLTALEMGIRQRLAPPRARFPRIFVDVGLAGPNFITLIKDMSLAALLRDLVDPA